MNVTIDTLIYSLQSKGGISRMFNEIIPRLQTLDPAMKMSYIISGNLLQPLPKVTNQVVYDISFIEKFFRPRRIWHVKYPEIKNLISKQIVHSTKKSIWHSTYFTDIAGWKGKKVVSVYDMIYELFEESYPSEYDHQFRIRKKKAIINSDVIICISNSTKQDLLERYSSLENRVEVVHLGTPTNFSLIDKNNIPDKYIAKSPFILFVGKRTHNKNFNQLLQAYSAWKEKDQILLYVVGNKWDSAELDSIKKLKIGKNVHLFESIDDCSLLFLYNQAIAFVYPSIYEGFGFPLLEAMSCGCPIVASRIPSTCEVAGEIPIYFNVGDTENFINALDSVLESKDVENRIKSGLARCKKFSWDKSAKQIYSIYQDLI